MTVSPLAAIPALALALLAGACASTSSSAVADGSRVLVRLYDAKQGIELALANKSHPGLQDVYSTERSSAALKLAPDDLVGDLIASLDQAGMTTYGKAESPSSDDKGYLLVDLDGEQRIFAQPAKGSPAEERQAWARIKLVMDHYYQHVGSLQYVENPRGGAIFRENG
jgi:hypothetical protein